MSILRSSSDRQCNTLSASSMRVRSAALSSKKERGVTTRYSQIYKSSVNHCTSDFIYITELNEKKVLQIELCYDLSVTGD